MLGITFILAADSPQMSISNWASARKTEKTSWGAGRRQSKDERLVGIVNVRRASYPRSPRSAGGAGRCRRGSVRVGLSRCRSWVWAAGSLQGCRADWEAYEPEETSDTAGGTSCRRWSWYLAGGRGGDQRRLLSIFSQERRFLKCTFSFVKKLMLILNCLFGLIDQCTIVQQVKKDTNKTELNQIKGSCYSKHETLASSGNSIQ